MKLPKTLKRAGVIVGLIGVLTSSNISKADEKRALDTFVGLNIDYPWNAGLYLGSRINKINTRVLASYYPGYYYSTKRLDTRLGTQDYSLGGVGLTFIQPLISKQVIHKKSFEVVGLEAGISYKTYYAFETGKGNTYESFISPSLGINYIDGKWSNWTNSIVIGRDILITKPSRGVSFIRLYQDFYF